MKSLRPEPPHIVTRSGVKVYDDWRDNIIVDAAVPPLVWKGGRDTFDAHTDVAICSRLTSENSKDALSWKLFLTLEKSGHDHRQELLARAEAKFEPSVCPLLAHMRRLRYLHDN